MADAIIAAAEELIDAAEEFCRRVEAGEIRSRYTYNRFKRILGVLRGPAPKPATMHRWIGIYASGDSKHGLWAPADLLEQIAYNVTYRPGRALVVDDTVVYRGLGIPPDTLRSVIDKYKDAEARGERHHP